MKYLVSSFILFSISSFSFAERMKTKVHSIIPGTPHDIIRFENGRVAFLEHDQKNLKTALMNQTMLEVDVDQNNQLLGIQSLKMQVENDPTPEVTTRPDYTPSILPSFEEVKKMFDRLNPNYQRESQCFNRAHVWAYEEFNKNKIYSMKTFVFFTASYINKNRFNWWFHVAPMVYVQEGSEVVERVLDYRYAHSPLKIKEWTDMFVFNKRPCKITTKFSEYDVNPQTEECYLINTTMYYWQPQDIHNEELQNRYKSTFGNFDVKASYQEAF